MEKYKAHINVGVVLDHLEDYAKLWRDLLAGKPTASIGFVLTTLSKDISREATSLSSQPRILKISSISVKLRAIVTCLGTEVKNLQ